MRRPHPHPPPHPAPAAPQKLEPPLVLRDFCRPTAGVASPELAKAEAGLKVQTKLSTYALSPQLGPRLKLSKLRETQYILICRGRGAGHGAWGMGHWAPSTPDPRQQSNCCLRQ